MKTQTILNVLGGLTSFYVLIVLGYMISGDWLGPSSNILILILAPIILAAFTIYGLLTTKIKTWIFIKYLIVFQIPLVFTLVESLKLDASMGPFIVGGILVALLVLGTLLHKHRTGNLFRIPDELKEGE